MLERPLSASGVGLQVTEVTDADTAPGSTATPSLPATQVVGSMPTTMDARGTDVISPTPDTLSGEVGEGGALLTAQNMDLLAEQEMAFAERDGLEMLRSVFDSMAVDGKITMDQLPFVLVGADVQATAKEIDDAIEEHIPDADDAEALLDFDQVQALYQQLVHNSMDLLTVDAGVLQQAQKESIFRRLWNWYQRKRLLRKQRQTAYEKHMKPTTRLLVLILCTSLIISLAVVLFAVLFIWTHSINTVANHIQRDIELMKDGLHLFGYSHPNKNYDASMQRLASLLDVVVTDLGYDSTERTLKSNLVYQQLLLGRLLDGWFEHDSLNTVSTSVMLVKGWMEMMFQTLSLTEMVALVDWMNPKMPEGHEILLARWNQSDPTNSTIQFLTDFKFKSMCVGVCGSTGGSTATRAALHGQTGAIFGQDYRPRPVCAGYTYLSNQRLALVYNTRLTVLRAEFIAPVSAVVDTLNANTASTNTSGSVIRRENTQEIVLGHQDPNTLQNVVLTSLRMCDAKCLAAANIDNSMLAKAIGGGSGVNETTDFHGELIFAAYGFMERSGLAMEVKLADEEFLDNLYFSIGDSLDGVNLLLKGTEEVQFVTFKKQGNGTSTAKELQFHTEFKYKADCTVDGVIVCGTMSNTSVFLEKALTEGEAGTMWGFDYRNEMVTAGYSDIDCMKGAISIKIDHSQIQREGLAMAGTIATFQNNVRYANMSTEIVVGQKKPGVKEAMSARDYNRVTVLKHRGDCPNMTCTGASMHMTSAVNHKTGYARGPDYRDKEVLGAYTYIDSLDVGLVIKIDASEAEQGSLMLTLQLLACSVGAVALSMVILAVLANVLLKSMDRAWEEGKQAIQREKDAFRGVIEAMYPAQVAKRMLAGETQIVYNVQAATVFFSDIYEFTTTSNSVTPEELIQFMGYTFGVMDVIAEHHHIYKVKTIGDAYLAVAGLPGVEAVNGNTTLDMVLFASCCAQVFSNRYLHPDDGAILDKVVTNLLAKRKAGAIGDPQQAAIAQIPKRPSLIKYGHVKDPAGVSTEPAEGGVPPVHCIMRYGVAAGPITAGVLQGKTPLFDIWGKTVNLASRMESTGAAGRIQVSEGVYMTVVALKGQPFTFDTRHKVFCKGFGNVSAYFVNACSISPPKEMLVSLNIEPNLGQFYFDNPIPGFKAGVKAGALSSGHASSVTGDQKSEHSSVVSGRNIRADADLH